MARHQMTTAELIAAYAGGERDFSEVQLGRANLRGVILDGANLFFAYLSRADLCEADLRNARLSRAFLESALLSGANLHRADLSRAILYCADLRGANMRDTDLSGANLERTDLSGADLSGADLSGANLTGAVLSFVNIDDAVLSQARLDYNVDLLTTARWSTITLDQITYHRKQVESGKEILPVGGANRLRFLFEAREALTLDELGAARDLARAFGSVARGARLAFELSAAGERLVVESVGSRETAAQVGLGFLRGIHSTQTELRTVLQQGDETNRRLDLVASQLESTQTAAHGERERLRWLLLSLLEKFEPVEVQNADEQLAAAFEKFAAEVGYRPGDLTIDGTILRFKRALARTAPATIALIAGAIAQAQGVPGGFDAGTAVAAVATAALAGGGRTDENGGKAE